MAHGVTTVRDPGCLNGVDWCLEARARSAANTVVAPRIFPYIVAVQTVGAAGLQVLGRYPGRLDTPDDFRRFVAWAKEKDVDGFKIEALDPELMTTLLTEAKKNGLGVAAHLSQLMVARFNGLQAATAGLTTLEHWYGLPESLFDDRTVQAYPDNCNYQDESHRFGQAGRDRIRRQAAAGGCGRDGRGRQEARHHHGPGWIALVDFTKERGQSPRRRWPTGGRSTRSGQRTRRPAYSTVMTILPRAWPSSRYARAAAASLNL